MNSKTKVEFGDFQTPPELAADVCRLLQKNGIDADIILEPTCGTGAFLCAAAKAFPKAQLLGWDINAAYVEQASQSLDRSGMSSRCTVRTQDFFKHDWTAELTQLTGNLLILGNPPWVTNAVVSSLEGENIPPRQNFHNHRGLAARTGKSNFDISEWMLINLLQALRLRMASIAVLCKTAVARKVLRFAWSNDGRIARASIYKIDAKKYFGAAVDACLILIGTGSDGPFQAPVFDHLEAQTPSKTIGLAGQGLVSNLPVYRQLQHLEGLCPYQWRSGVKHDCSSIMEFRREGQTLFRNGLDETVNLEEDFLYPLLKCSDLANGRVEPERFVLLTQTRVGEDTSGISIQAPRIWNYLNSHLARFEARKSSIYANRMPFALFGIGEYSFTPWKVAVSGLHKTPHFVVVGAFEGKPILFDDTCYFLSFQNYEEAALVAHILNSELSQQFLSSILFDDSKRPITVELLQRLDLHNIANETGLADQWQRIRELPRNNLEASSSFQAELFRESARGYRIKEKPQKP